MKIDEIIVLFHLGDDFPRSSPSSDPINYTFNNAGQAEVHPDNARLRHDLTHYYLGGYLSFRLVETIRSNYLTPRVVEGLVRNWNGGPSVANISTRSGDFDLPRLQGSVKDTYTITEPGHAGIRDTILTNVPDGNNFIFVQGGNEETQEAINITRSILETAAEITTANGITLRLVTIPVFPEAFFEEFQTGNWDPQIGGYDLFFPEDALTEIARDNHIPILPMGNYMQFDGVSADEIKQFYYADGLGHFTPRGHEYFANAIYSCFYSEGVNALCTQ